MPLMNISGTNTAIVVSDELSMGVITSLVPVTGLVERQLQIVPDPGKLAVLGLSIEDIENVLAQNNVKPGGGQGHRNGNDRFLPSTQNEKELADLDVRGASFSEVPLTISGLATKEDTDGVMERLETFFGSKQQFHDKYEAVLMDMIQCAFLRNEAECTQGYLLTDEEVEARLRGLGNMRNVDEAKLEKCVHNASALSRPLLERIL